MDLKYHPRRFSTKLDKFMADTVQDFNDKKLTKAIREITPNNFEETGELDEIFIYQDYYIQNLEDSMNDIISQNDLFLFRNFSSRKALSGWYEAQADFFLTYARFLNIGSNIFEIPLFLSEMFDKTDLDKICIKDIILPYNAMYLYIASDDEMLLDGRRYKFEGCYIVKTEPNHDNDREVEINGTFLHFYLTTSCNNMEYESVDFATYLSNEKILDFIMCLEDQGDYTIEEYLKEMGNNVSLAKNRLEIYLNDELKKWKPYLSKVFAYIINALFFICYQEEKDYEKVKIIQSKHKKRKFTKNDVEKEYTIYICGNKLKEKYKSNNITGNILTAHSRRGHWRNQAYGKKYSQHKKIWIQPTIIHKNEEIKINHIYQISESDEKNKRNGT
jgi:hypothetical protein